MGNPHDLGMSIVEGTYNGLLEKSLYRKIHFSGALNGGMSGGPALSRSSGKLVGLNHGFGQSSTSEIGFVADITGAIAVIRRALEP